MTNIVTVSSHLKSFQSQNVSLGFKKPQNKLVTYAQIAKKKKKYLRVVLQ